MNLSAKDFQKKLLRWYKKEDRQLPWRLLWQKTADPYVILVSEVMLQQTTIKAVTPAFSRFMKRFPNVKTLAEASTEKIKQTVSGLGYYNRFSRLQRTCQEILAASKNPLKLSWPQSLSEWKKLPGVGDYTAAAVSSIAFRLPHAVVDGNVERVFCRLMNWKKVPSSPEVKKEILSLSQKLICQQNPGDYNQAVMELGQTVCTPFSPRCSLCPLSASCQAFQKKTTALIPLPKPKVVLQELDLSLTLFEYQEKIVLFKRSINEKFLKEIIGFKTKVYDEKPSKILKEKKYFGSFSHRITSYKLRVFVFYKRVESLEGDFFCLAKKDLSKNLTASLDRKAWDLFIKKNRNDLSFLSGLNNLALQ